MTPLEELMSIGYVVAPGWSRTGNRGHKCSMCGDGAEFETGGPVWSKACEFHAVGMGAMVISRMKPGRPVTTGSAATKKVAFRVSAAQRAELDAEAKRLGLSSADVAAKRRTFPEGGK